MKSALIVAKIGEDFRFDCQRQGLTLYFSHRFRALVFFAYSRKRVTRKGGIVTALYLLDDAAPTKCGEDRFDFVEVVFLAPCRELLSRRYPEKAINYVPVDVAEGYVPTESKRPNREVPKKYAQAKTVVRDGSAFAGLVLVIQESFDLVLACLRDLVHAHSIKLFEMKLFFRGRASLIGLHASKVPQWGSCHSDRPTQYLCSMVHESGPS